MAHRHPAEREADAWTAPCFLYGATHASAGVVSYIPQKLGHNQGEIKRGKDAISPLT